MPKSIILPMQDYPFALNPFLLGGGKISSSQEDVLRLSLPSNSKVYCDSQLDDYHPLPRSAFKWSPPVNLNILARTSHSAPSGTLGFGFWNDPFTISLGQGGAARRLPAPPQTLWFFYGSQENDLPLVPGIPGNGWKSASLRSPKIPPLLLAPLAAAAIGLSSIPLLRSWIIQSAINRVDADEVILDLSLNDWHLYAIEWTNETATFRVDDVVIHETSILPSGPLGFVLWIDNQFAIANPTKGFRFGTNRTHDDEWMEVRILQLSSG
jgi:hypothetical protein